MKLKGKSVELVTESIAWLEIEKRLKRGKCKMEGQDEKKASRKNIGELIEKLLEKTGGGERRR
jgi:hypothetical protein